VSTRQIPARQQNRHHQEVIYLDPVPDAYPGEVVIMVDCRTPRIGKNEGGSFVRPTVLQGAPPGGEEART
jgi:hypothetical protein